MLRYNKAKGMVLFFVLIMLQIIMLFSLGAIRAVLFEARAVQADIDQHTLLSSEKAILTRVEHDFLQHQPVCRMPAMSQAELLAKPLSWWQSPVTCAGIFHGFQYYYVVETLGEDACASVTDAQAAADYYRMTVFLKSQQSSQSLYLQSTIVKPAQVSLACEGASHSVTSGRQSWRMLSN